MMPGVSLLRNRRAVSVHVSRPLWNAASVTHAWKPSLSLFRPLFGFGHVVRLDECIIMDVLCLAPISDLPTGAITRTLCQRSVVGMLCFVGL